VNTGQNVRNSDNDPLRIAELRVPGMRGLIGMTICPGKKGPSLYGTPWNRDLDVDMQYICDEWQANIMVTLLEKHEFEMLGIEAMEELVSQRWTAIQWVHLEITDGGIPDERFERHWLQVRAQLIGALAGGGKVLVHCRGGLGRTGLVVARLLVETGMSPDEAIQSVRAARKGAIETEEQENYVRNIRPALPASLHHGLTLPLNEMLKIECIAEDDFRAREMALTVFSMILARWCAHPSEFHNPRLLAKLLGVDELVLEQYWCSQETSLPITVIKRIDLLSRICIALQTIAGHNAQLEIEWLEYTNQGNAPLLQLLDNQSPLDFIKMHGIAGLETVCGYLEERAACIQNNERYLLCLGVCNTLFDTPHVQVDMVLALTLQGVQNPQDAWQADIMAVRNLPSAIPLGERHVLLPRPHLQELIAYIQQQPNLDVAIISGATREYIDKFLGMVAPELLKMCQFIWSREDKPSYYKRGASTTIKSLENIPELKGYRAGRILMVEHGYVLPYASHLRVSPFYGETFTAASLENEKGLQDVIRRLSILTQVDDIIALRKTEEAAFRKHAEQVTAWVNESKISMFDAGYSEKKAACPFKPPISIDDIRANID
jgi:hypothetical protein